MQGVFVLQTQVRRRFRREQPVDWFRILADLQYAGFSNADVAKILGVSASTVRTNWKRGRMPRHHDGQALLALHELVMLVTAECKKT